MVQHHRAYTHNITRELRNQTQKTFGRHRSLTRSPCVFCRRPSSIFTNSRKWLTISLTNIKSPTRVTIDFRRERERGSPPRGYDDDDDDDVIHSLGTSRHVVADGVLACSRWPKNNEPRARRPVVVCSLALAATIGNRVRPPVRFLRLARPKRAIVSLLNIVFDDIVIIPIIPSRIDDTIDTIRFQTNDRSFP